MSGSGKFKGKKSQLQQKRRLWERRASLCPYGCRRGNAWSHWHQPTRGQFPWHSTESTGNKRVLHSSALLLSQMENPRLGREDNPVGLVWKNTLNTMQAGGFTIPICPRAHSHCAKAEVLLQWCPRTCSFSAEVDSQDVEPENPAEPCHYTTSLNDNGLTPNNLQVNTLFQTPSIFHWKQRQW